MRVSRDMWVCHVKLGGLRSGKEARVVRDIWHVTCNMLVQEEGSVCCCVKSGMLA
jgi:hypothetical protein